MNLVVLEWVRFLRKLALQRTSSDPWVCQELLTEQQMLHEGQIQKEMALKLSKAMPSFLIYFPAKGWCSALPGSGQFWLQHPHYRRLLAAAWEGRQWKVEDKDKYTQLCDKDKYKQLCDKDKYTQLFDSCNNHQIRMVPDPEKFPNGIKYLADYFHERF